MIERNTSGAGQELIVITRAYDLVREITLRVDRFPRSRKFVLGDRMLSNAYLILETLIEAKYTRQRSVLLDRANIALEKLRFQLRLAHDDRVMSTRHYEGVARRIDEVGRLVGGWRRGSGKR